VVAQQNQVNYIRNSVKATVDAYDGTVKLYTWDDKDPVLKTWKKAFPGTVLPKKDIPQDLMEHLRYPQDMFKVQREMLALYHVTDPQQFYNASDAWQVPNDPTKRDNSAVPPYYLSLEMPGQSDRQFSLTSTFTPSGRPNLRAFMAVDADATSKNYGTIRLLRVTEDKVDGPEQVQNKLNSITPVADFIRDMKGADSTVLYGNLLTVPLDDGFLYVEPIYAQGRNSAYPLLRKVAVSYGDKTGFADTLSDSLNQAFGVNGAQPPQPQQPGDRPGPQNPTVKDALRDAQKAFDDGQAALKKGDWAAYGKAQDSLQEALKSAADAQAGQGGSGTDTNAGKSGGQTGSGRSPGGGKGGGGGSG
jgi:uncharacterized membrane protein (UPF0182 family)